MINWKSLVIAIALVTLPLGAYAVQSHLETGNELNSIQESTNMRHFAQRNEHGKRGRGLDKLMQQLDLTPEQSQQIEAIQEDSREIAEDLKEQMRSQREEMKSLMASDADAGELRTQHQEAQSLHQQASNNRFETMLSIREVLTPEQRAEMAELVEQHRGKRSDKRNEG
ncbi:MAG: Spy/CpxP family protein refolding chaperone [Pleurocapsa sp.]